MEIREVLNSVTSLFLIMIVGVYARKKKIVNDEIEKGLTAILLKITLPLLIVSSFTINFQSDIVNSIIKAFIFSFICLIIGGIVSYIFLIPMKGDKKKILQFSNVFSNCGFIGFPVIGSIYGAEGIIYTSIFNMFFTVFLWTYGVMLFSDKLSKDNIKKIFLNPGIVAVYIGLILLIFKIKLPVMLDSSIKMVGNMTPPISMVIIGSMLVKVDIKKAFEDLSIYYGAFLKLIIVPLSIYIFGKVIGDNSVVMKTMILLQAMPTAAMASIFAETFNKEEDYATMVVFITTLFSIITFPLVTFLFT